MKQWVLVVDDDVNMTNLVSMRLESAGFSVTTAHDAKQAYIQAEALRPILVVSDMQMPGFGSGADAVKAMRECPFLRATPIIILTGMDLREAAGLLPKDPFVRLMGKPLNWPLMSQTIQDLLKIAPGAAPAAPAPAPTQPPK
ncbi:MAG TPA: response regulator [Elusimicrobiota bacterium]|jgi:two-component system response regulator GlrR|nr:response regulator [Elusimicrobiota bacterium]